ncbi:hypothetical protein PMI30_03025 [Pseudomonas sp. GM50]|nr:hypothetical protein PMI30_03025 [Pseudomonas sp. GM50]
MTTLKADIKMSLSASEQCGVKPNEITYIDMSPRAL